MKREEEKEILRIAKKYEEAARRVFYLELRRRGEKIDKKTMNLLIKLERER